MKSLLPVALFLLLIVIYFSLAMGMGLDQRIPWLPLLLGAAICGWAASRWWNKRSVSTFLAAAITVFLMASLSWYTLDYSNYEAHPLNVDIGQKVAGIETMQLLDHRGQLAPVLASETGSQATLVVLYRGHW